MFITLRSSGGQAEARGGKELEQVARRNAGPGVDRVVKDRVRAARRPACVACQTKKLRCTGNSPHSCDRCRARLIECVVPTSKQQANHGKNLSHSVQPRSPSRHVWQGVGDASPRPDDAASAEARSGSGNGNGTNLGSFTPPQQADNTTSSAPVGVDPLDGAFFDRDYPADQAWATGLTTTATAGDLIDDLDVDMGDQNRDGAPAPLEVRSGIDFTNSGNNDTTPRSPTQPREPSAASVPPPPNPDQSSSPPCSCLTDLVRVVQQLDDDEFHITTMSLDQVLQLQKWIIFQCCKPLDCAKCLDLSTIHTMRLILCDRLTEMFECIHLRVKRAGAILTGGPSPPDSSTQPSPSPLPDSSSSTQSPSPLYSAQQQQQPAAPAPPPTQLFCGSSGRAANAAACNPLMFSDAFRNQYSDEEQVHMIRVLLGLQSRNFQKLLLRVEATTQVAASPARRAKVMSMMGRLAKASADIEGALRVVFGWWLDELGEGVGGGGGWVYGLDAVD